MMYGYVLKEMGLLDKAHSVVVAVGHDEYRALSAEELRGLLVSDSNLVADLKSIYDKKTLELEGFKVLRL